MSETYWVDGAHSTIRLSGAATGGRLAVLEETLPAGPGPPLHAHPEDETYHVLEGELRVWTLEPEAVPLPLSAWPSELAGAGERCGPGSTHFIPGGAPHSYCVLGETARILVLSTPAGLEEWIRAFGVPASRGSPPADPPPEISAERRREFATAHGLRRLGPPPPAESPVPRSGTLEV